MITQPKEQPEEPTNPDEIAGMIADLEGQLDRLHELQDAELRSKGPASPGKLIEGITVTVESVEVSRPFTFGEGD